MIRDRLYEKLGLPVNLEAERCVLGSILLDGEMFPDVAGALDARDFSLEKHQRIFLAFADLHERGEKIDRVTLAHELDRRRQLESCDGLSYLVELDSDLPKITNLDSYVGIVKERAICRRAITELDATIAKLMQGDDASVSIIQAAQKALQDLGDSQANKIGPQTPHEIIEAHPGGINAFLQPHIHGAGIKTPWPTLTRMIGGLYRGQFILLAARPSVGKTAAVMQMAECAAGLDVGVAVFSLEMPKEQLLHRMICARAGVDSHDFRCGRLNQDDRALVARAAGQIAKLPLYIADSGARTVPALHAALRRLTLKHGIGLVVVDYLQLMSATGRAEGPVQIVTQISKGLKAAAMEAGLPFLVLSQLSRLSDHEKRRPVLSDLRDSGSLEQDADLVIFIHQPSMQKGGDQSRVGEAEFIVAKQRNGPTGRVNMRFLARHVKFGEAADD